MGVDAAYVALVAPGVVPHRRHLHQLARAMAEANADVGLGPLQLSGGRRVLPLPRIEDLRFRESAATAIMVLARTHLARVLRHTRWSNTDPFWHWRFARTAVALGHVLATDVPLGSAEGDGPSSHRIPIDAAGPDSAGPDATGPDSTRDPRADLILVYGVIDASVSVYFDGLPPDIQQRIRYLHPSPSATEDLPFFVAASLVIIVRTFEVCARSGALELLDGLQVPYAWFVDDNLLALAHDHSSFSYYTHERVEAFVSGVAGVIASTPILAEAMAVFGAPVLHWPCVFDATLTAAAPPEHDADAPPVVAVVGGSFRRQCLTTHLLPALDRIDRDRRITVHAKATLLRGPAHPRVHAVAAEKSFRQFVYRWRSLDCDILAHPAGDAVNMPFKSKATLLAARYLGAVPIVADEPTWAGMGRSEGVIVAAGTIDAWAHALRELFDPHVRRTLFDRLDGWCRAEFRADAARDRIDTLDAWSAPATAAERERRRHRARTVAGLPGADPDNPSQAPALAAEQIVRLSAPQAVRRALGRARRQFSLSH